MNRRLPPFVSFIAAAAVLLAGSAAAQETPPPETTPAPAEAAPEPVMMKAVRVHAFGGLEALQFEDAPRPDPADDEILIRVMAAGVNPVDASLPAGRFSPMLGTKLPLIPSLDV